MKAIRTGRTNDKRRNAWEPPVVTKVAIGAETKSVLQSKSNAGLAEPQPPSPPATKLGFAFEMAFPMSSRSEQ
jgi:hypothetical protein